VAITQDLAAKFMIEDDNHNINLCWVIRWGNLLVTCRKGCGNVTYLEWRRTDVQR